MIRILARPRSIALVAGAVLATTIAPAAAASSALVRSADADAVPLTTTTIDKPWYTVERFELGLINCTRTGGWVLSDGTCRGYGSGHYSKYVSPLVYATGLSDKVSRPYAKLLVTKNLCSHYADHDPAYRLRRAGYTHYTWGENIGCRDGYASAKAAVLASHLAMQREKSTGGGHWKNIKNARYHWIGIGVWRSGSRTRLVTDFYGTV
ncbi:MAG TPA: hypothetical protein VFI34_05505 [Candidatus Limnocylindrales bacterium]|nr:hypothetical protein [Candidatus Limnocylindrales bacterium]